MRNHPDVTSLVRETYQILTTIAAGDEDKGLLDQLDTMRARFDEACETFSAAMAMEELAVAQLRGELSTRSTETEQLRQESSKLASLLEQQSVEIRGVAAERDALVQVHDSLIADRNDLVAVQGRLIAERDALLRDRDGIINERDALLTSRSWRLTAPLRLIGSMFTRG
jgi:hypothetical protein